MRPFESAAPEEEDQVDGERGGTAEPAVATSMEVRIAGEDHTHGLIALMDGVWVFR